MTVGVVGFGRIGRLLTRYFAKDADILVYDTRLDARAVRALGARPATLAQACAADAVVLCVPMAAFEGVVRRIRGLVRPGTVVADVCSLKEHPVRVMKRLLPRGVHILATHPNFGPDSAAETLQGRKLVVWPVRIPRAVYARARRAFAAKGLDVVELSPKEHDRRMASSLVLTHFIGRGLVAYGAKPTGVDTEGYKRLLRILETVQNDSWQLFKDMNRFNAYAAPMRRRLLRSLRSVEARL